MISLLQQDLDNGEAEAIALLLEQSSEALLLDEKKARQVARRMTLPILGTLGLLIWAKRQGVMFIQRCGHSSGMTATCGESHH